ncbi:hypothetical protein O4J56_30720, partial [Nocardiopsis sp. RSe5-2]|nr:hypothetical protein [Nocardiopsis endophytica]
GGAAPGGAAPADPEACGVAPAQQPWGTAPAAGDDPAPAPGAVVGLEQRGAALRPVAQRAVLPGDPTLVVRDAADDPSYSPD